jgi:hypothetical protein
LINSNHWFVWLKSDSRIVPATNSLMIVLGSLIEPLSVTRVVFGSYFLFISDNFSYFPARSAHVRMAKVDGSKYLVKYSVGVCVLIRFN